MSGNMKYLIAFSLLFLLTLFACEREKSLPESLTQTKAAEKKTTLYWTCGMHPSVRSDKPGKCPICNMDLVPVKEEMGAEEEGVVSLKLSPRAEKLAGVRTFEVAYLPLVKELRAVGEIDYDERKRAYVASRLPGRIDKLFVDFTGTTVKKGEPLIWIYSPVLLSTQEEYLLALETLEKVKESPFPEVLENARSLVESTKRRLLLWGITEEQIKELAEKKTTKTQMTIYAPISGTVIHKTALEGKYVKEGENIYCIADLSNVWMFADIYEEDISWLRLGQEVEIVLVAYPGEIFRGKISFINPYLDEQTRTVKVRAAVPNPAGKLKPGMYVDILIKAPMSGEKRIFYTCPMHPEVVAKKSGECPECGMYLKKREGRFVLALPKSAVLDVGVRKLVYISKGEGRYEAREIMVGSEATIDGGKQRFFTIRAGLSEGDKVVTRANFLIDSQTQLTGEAAGIYGGVLKVEERK